MGFTALDSESVQSSVFREGPLVWAVWCAILAAKDQDGVTSINPHFLAHQWSVEVGVVQEAWDVLTKPDPTSKNKEYEGRRIVPSEVAPGNWYVTSHDVYRDKWRKERRKEINRISQKRARLKKAGKLCHYESCDNPTYGNGERFCPEHSFEEAE